MVFPANYSIQTYNIASLSLPGLWCMPSVCLHHSKSEWRRRKEGGGRRTASRIARVWLPLRSFGVSLPRPRAACASSLCAHCFNDSGACRASCLCAPRICLRAAQQRLLHRVLSLPRSPCRAASRRCTCLQHQALNIRRCLLRIASGNRRENNEKRKPAALAASVSRRRKLKTSPSMAPKEMAKCIWQTARKRNGGGIALAAKSYQYRKWRSGFSAAISSYRPIAFSLARE